MLRKLGYTLCVTGVTVNAVLATLSDFGRWPLGAGNELMITVISFTAVVAIGMVLLAMTQSLPFQQPSGR